MQKSCLFSFLSSWYHKFDVSTSFLSMNSCLWFTYESECMFLHTKHVLTHCLSSFESRIAGSQPNTGWLGSEASMKGWRKRNFFPFCSILFCVQFCISTLICFFKGNFPSPFRATIEVLYNRDFRSIQWKNFMKNGLFFTRIVHYFSRKTWTLVFFDTSIAASDICGGTFSSKRHRSLIIDISNASKMVAKCLHRA